MKDRKELINKWMTVETQEIIGRCIDYSSLAEEDIWFLIPNNMKRSHGFAASRTVAKRKSKYKRKKHNRIRTTLYELIFQELNRLLSQFVPDNIDNTRQIERKLQ